MEKETKLAFLYTKVHTLLSFLDAYLPLANLHNTDFIVHHLWELYIPECIQNDLVGLDNEQLMKLPSGRLYEARDVSYSRDHTKTENSTEQKLASSRLETIEISVKKSELHCVGDKSNFKNVCLPKDARSKIPPRPKIDRSCLPDWRHSTLEEFVKEARRNTLQGLAVLTSVAELEQQWSIRGTDSIAIKNFMSAKKGHEVDIMAHMCATVARHHGLDMVSQVVFGCITGSLEKCNQNNFFKH